MIANWYNHPKANGVIGSLPQEWIDKIPKFKRPEAIKELYKSWGEAISKFREELYQSLKADSDMEQTLLTAMQKADILPNMTSLRINEKLDTGSYGTVYFINNPMGDKYVIKIFHKKALPSNSHNNHIESNRACFWQKQLGKKTNRPRFFFADMKNGYMVTQYIDDKTPLPKKNLSPKYLGLVAKDEETDFSILYGHNKINGYSVDYGGLKVQSYILANNKTARYIYKKITKAPKNLRLKLFEDIFEHKNVPRYNDRLAGLTTGVKMLPKKHRGKWFKVLAKNADSEIKKVLASNLSILPDDKTKGECFKILAQGADNELKIVLVDSLYCFSERAIEDYFKLLENGANKELKKKLVDKLSLLPQEKLAEWHFKLHVSQD